MLGARDVFRFQNTNNLKVTEQKNIFHANRTRMAILMSEKNNFKTNIVQGVIKVIM